MIQTIPVAITLADDSIAIMHFVVQGRGNALPEGASWIDASKKIWARSAKSLYISDEVTRTFPNSKGWQHILPEAIPTDRTFRDALTVIDGQLAHDLTKAKEVVLRTVRHERARKFESLDREYLRHVGIHPDQASTIEAERQRLRDLPASLTEQMAGVTDLEALKPFMVV